jgi:predicted DNA-binding transcriptional regulator AlpA
MNTTEKIHRAAGWARSRTSIARELCITDELLANEYVNVNHIVAVKELAEFFGVGRTTISQWYYRQADNGMPSPVKTIGSKGTIWDLEEVVLWWLNWKNPSKPKAGTLPANYKEILPNLERVLNNSDYPYIVVRLA